MAKNIRKKTTKKPRVKKVKLPACFSDWTALFYGARGSCKSLHQARMCDQLLKHLEYLYSKKPLLNRAIVFSVQRFNKEIEKKYLGTYLFYWNEAKELRYCPRKQCWKGEDRHRLHGCYVVFDDIATILPADNWNNTPVWLRKTFAQARHFGIHVIANLQDPFSVDVNFRRYVDMAYRFRKVMGSRDPDETRPPVKRIWGWYQMRKIAAERLWQIGNIGETEIQILKEKQKQMDEVVKTHFARDLFRGSLHMIRRKDCDIYDTTQDVPEYRPSGFTHKEIFCTDPSHDHDDKSAPNYCGFKKVTHELV